MFVSTDPVTTIYNCPRECVLFDPQRDANPFFHLMCAIWFLSGHTKDVSFIKQFNSQYGKYTEEEDGTAHGCYGYRWRKHFGEYYCGTFDSPKDQLVMIADALSENPECRRQVLSMWDANSDLGADKKDIPCNLQVHFQLSGEHSLMMTVFNRSNDALFGTYGEDVVTFSMLQQYMAARIGVSPGRYWQVSNNWHAYVDQLKKMGYVDDEGCPIPRSEPLDPYDDGRVVPIHLEGNMDLFDQNCRMLIDGDDFMGPMHPYFKRVVLPMATAYWAFKNNQGKTRYELALKHLSDMPHGCDWRLAGEEWIKRRMAKWSAS